MERWPTISSEKTGDFKVFSVRTVVKKSPVTGQPHNFYIIDSVNWVNVIAVTPDRELVMVEQFRHGADEVELEVPGGMMDDGDGKPEVTGARELQEETGYTGENARIIGSVLPNPAIMSNTCFTVMLENCRLTSKTHFDATEDVITRLVPVAEIPDLVRSGKIRHSLVIAALYHFELLFHK